MKISYINRFLWLIRKLFLHHNNIVVIVVNELLSFDNYIEDIKMTVGSIIPMII